MGDSRGVAPMQMEGNVADNWKIWRSRFENYLVASEINKKDESIQCAQVLHYIGEGGFKVFTTFTFEEDQKNKLKILLDKFESHFLPKENLTYERFKLFSYKQKDETLDQFVTEIKKMAIRCKLGSLQEELTKTVLITGINNPSIREKLLQEDDSLSLDKAIEKCNILLMSKERSENMSQVKIDALQRGRTGTIHKKNNQMGQSGVPKKTINSCTKCGRSHEINKCPAFGRECNFCKIKNHFSNMCRKKKQSNKNNKVNEIQNTEQINVVNKINDNFLFIGSVEVNEINNNRWFSVLEINKKEIKLKIDTGAQANILPLKLYNSLGIKSNLRQTQVTLTSYTGNNLKIVGKCYIPCKKDDKTFNLEFYIVDSNTQAILGLDSSLELNLIKRIDSLTKNCQYNSLINEFSELFEGIGCINEPYHIEIDKNAKPVVHPTRKVALPLMDDLKQSLAELEKSKIIERVQKPTDWVNALVLVRKPDKKLRICLDPLDLNKVIKREYCHIPTLEEITSKLAGSTIFSTLDATQGFYSILLDDASADLCTFGTPFGRYRFLRLPYGIKSAPEVFQSRFKQIFNLEGVDVYIDDILIWGKTKSEHDERLKKVLQIAKETNVRFNLHKCRFGVNEINYMGHVISGAGISPENSKINAITQIPKPQNKQELQRLLGMITYVSKFINNFSSATSVLRNLLKKDVEFLWQPEHDKAFENLKNTLINKPVLQFYDVNCETVLSVDASKDGLGAVLMQNHLPCAYASRSMTETQTRYAQIEKELLAITFGLNRFYQYIFGKTITVETDHLPLLSIFKKPLNKCPARLQRMLLQVQKFDIKLKYKPGKDLLIADALSRACVGEMCDDEIDDEINAQVCLIESQINVTDRKLNEIIEKTKTDKELQVLKQVILEGWPNNFKKVPNSVKIYRKFQSDLSVQGDLIFKGQSLVIPQSMRKEMLERVHYNHMGINKCIKLAQESIFWPTMCNEIRQTISQCHLCLKYARSQMSEPLINHKIPEIPWNKVGCDIFELHGQKYLLIIDYYSKYIEVEKLENCSTSYTTVKILKSVFARHGIPLTVVTDGGPQFSSDLFQAFSQEWEFDHVISSPRYAQSNGMAERNVQTAKNIFKKVFEDKKDIYLALLLYRNMQIHGAYSPAQILMSRKLRCIIPSTEASLKPKLIDTNKYNTSLQDTQVNQQKYYNKKGVFNLKPLEVGSHVYVQVQPNSSWSPALVLEKVRNRMYRVQLTNGSVLLRNRRFIKPVDKGKSVIPVRPTTSIKPFVQNNTQYFIELEPDCDLNNRGEGSNYNVQEETNVNTTESEDDKSVETRNGMSGDRSDVMSENELDLDNSDSNSSASDTNSDYELKYLNPEKTRSGRLVKKPHKLNL